MSRKSIKKKRTRTLKERAKEIFDYIDYYGEPFPKTKLRELGLDSKSVNNWIDLIIFIQEQPEIQLLKVGNYTLVQNAFGDKFLRMCWKKFKDRKESHEIRLKYLEDFGRAYFLKEKAGL
ncbi:MAG: hypothetical protein ACFFD4_05655 [Candidatus Odinarchaeota archaeon]